MRRDEDRHLAEEELELFLSLPDGEARREPPASCRRHLETCARCRRELDSLRSLHRALSALPELSPSPGFTEAVLSRVELPRPWYARVLETLRRHWPALLLGLGLATVTVGGMVGWLAAQPELTLGGLARFTLDRLSGFAWSVVLTAARLLWATGLPDAIADFTRRVDPVQAALAMATLSAATAAAAAAMAKLLRSPPPVAARAR